MTTSQDQKIVRKSPRWVKILLVLSLAVNMLIIGTVAGSFFFGPGHRFTGMSSYNNITRPAALHVAGRMLVWKLPRARRQAVFALVRKHREAIAPLFDKLDAKRMELAKILASETTDSQKFKTVFDEITNIEAEIHLKASALTEKFITGLEPAERRLYAEILQNPPHMRGFGMRRGGGPSWLRKQD